MTKIKQSVNHVELKKRRRKKKARISKNYECNVNISSVLRGRKHECFICGVILNFVLVFVSVFVFVFVCVKLRRCIICMCTCICICICICFCTCICIYICIGSCRRGGRMNVCGLHFGSVAFSRLSELASCRVFTALKCICICISFCTCICICICICIFTLDLWPLAD